MVKAFKCGNDITDEIVKYLQDKELLKTHGYQASTIKSLICHFEDHDYDLKEPMEEALEQARKDLEETTKPEYEEFLTDLIQEEEEKFANYKEVLGSVNPKDLAEMKSIKQPVYHVLSVCQALFVLLNLNAAGQKGQLSIKQQGKLEWKDIASAVCDMSWAQREFKGDSARDRAQSVGKPFRVVYAMNGLNCTTEKNARNSSAAAENLFKFVRNVVFLASDSPYTYYHHWTNANGDDKEFLSFLSAKTRLHTLENINAQL